MFNIFIRTIIMYVFVTVAIRLMGKRQIGEMQPNELVITLLISEIAAMPLQDTTQPLINGIAAILLLVILEIAVSSAAMKSIFLRRMTSGQSVVIIKNGIIDEEAMRRVRMTVLDLIEQLRMGGVFDISEVAYAVLEVNGSLSILRKSAFEPPTRDDLKTKIPPDKLSLPVICDGCIIKESLVALGIDYNELKSQLKEKGITEKDVLLMTEDRYKNASICCHKEKI